MKLTFWGTRGSIAAPGKETIVYGGNTCCIEIDLESGKKIIIDAGTGIRPLGDHLIAQGNRVDVHLLVTHIHWDHIQGFPFFDPVFKPETRITVCGFPAGMKGLRAIFDNKLGDGFFPIKFDELGAQIAHLGSLDKGGPLHLDNCRIDAIPLNHPQGAFGYRFEEDGKKLVFITDNELTDSARPGFRREDYIGFCKDAHILIHDAQFTHEEIDQHRGWGHSDSVSTLDLALKAHVKRLLLFHHNPSRTDKEVQKIEERCNTILRDQHVQMSVEGAREGTEIVL
ncbi:MAG: MBL fold metallo-hydrolase [Deltaproteobacteria bacterium]|nr:MBL fold metallo-hydrolase [Deltaproteobacteria bacterium]